MTGHDEKEWEIVANDGTLWETLDNDGKQHWKTMGRDGK